MYQGMFEPDQLRYIEEELRRISAAINTHDTGWYPRWDDLRFPFTQTKLGANLKPDFDYTNVGLLFPPTAGEANEVIFMIGQMPHGYRPGSGIRPHVHFQQASSAVTTWALEYKWFNPGAAVPASFTTITASSGIFPYVSGNLHQISGFTEIDGTGMSLSSILLMKLYRTDSNPGDVLSFELDIHYQTIAPGSLNEFTEV